MQTEFTEKQKFTQWWLWLFLIGLGLFQIYGLFSQLIKGVPFGNKPMSDIGLIFFTLIPFGLLFFFGYMKLETKIDEKEIQIVYTPLAKKTFLWEDVKSASVIKYKFSGYGVRLSPLYGTVYNTKGNKGLAIELKSGEKILIGTQKTDELTKYIENIKKHKQLI